MGRLIRLELAGKLKEAGLKWEPKGGDWFIRPTGEIVLKYSTGPDSIYGSKSTWLPSLSQLLVEIEARGLMWSLKLLSRPQYRVILYPKGLSPGGDGSIIFQADTPEEAAGQALLWVLEQEGKA